MTPKVGRAWKSSEPSLYVGGSGQHATIKLSTAKTHIKCSFSADFEKSLMKNLLDIFKIGALGADAQVVEHYVALLVRELGALGLGLLGLCDGLKVLIVARAGLR